MLLPHQQFRHSQNLAGEVNDAIGQEMRSRVAQSREQARMQQQAAMAAEKMKHEKELKRMELDARSKPAPTAKDPMGDMIRQLLEEDAYPAMTAPAYPRR